MPRGLAPPNPIVHFSRWTTRPGGIPSARPLSRTPCGSRRPRTSRGRGRKCEPPGSPCKLTKIKSTDELSFVPRRPVPTTAPSGDFSHFVANGAGTAKQQAAGPLQASACPLGGPHSPLRLQEGTGICRSSDRTQSRENWEPWRRDRNIPETKNGHRSVRAEISAYLLCVGRPHSLSRDHRDPRHADGHFP